MRVIRKICHNNEPGFKDYYDYWDTQTAVE
jgi:hypothetical protein